MTNDDNENNDDYNVDVDYKVLSTCLNISLTNVLGWNWVGQLLNIMLLNI